MPTASYGITSIASRANFDEAIVLADAGLYRAKALSGDRALRDDRVTTDTEKEHGDPPKIVNPNVET